MVRQKDMQDYFQTAFYNMVLFQSLPKKKRKKIKRLSKKGHKLVKKWIEKGLINLPTRYFV